MAVKKGWKTGPLHWPGSQRGHGRDEEIAERLTPLEETEEFRKSHQVEGRHGADDTIHVGSASVRMPDQFAEDEREGASIFRLEPVVLFILLAMLAFIGFVAWQITLMPPK